MRTNPETRKTMPDEWIWFFNEIETKYKWGKYYKTGGFQTCAYNSETKNSRILEAAPRRQKGVRICLLCDPRRSTYESIFNTNDIKVNEIFATCSYRYGGLWVYDERILATTPTKPRNGNPYFQVDRTRCTKVCDIWDVPKFTTTKMELIDVYHVARNQYEHMLHDNIYDRVQTWEDLPDYCLWKWMHIDGDILHGREEAFKAYVDHTKALDGYVPAFYDSTI